MRQRGDILVTILVCLIAAAAVLGGLYAIYETIDSRGYERGQAAVRAEWREANKKAEAEEEDARKERARIAESLAADLEAANGRARDADARWRRERAARSGQPLAVCDVPAQPQTAGVGSVSPSLRLDTAIHFTVGFLREYDSAWTDQSGQPVWPDPGGPVKETAAASSIGPSELLGTHGENAARCSADRRQLNSLISTIEQLRAAWDNRKFVICKGG